MPGIVGLITKSLHENAEQILLQMVKTICHEPFYVSGTHIDKTLGVYAGWVARQNSFADAMPLVNERGDVTLLFAGEDFPAPDTVQRLKIRGHTVEPEGPAYLVHLYEEDAAFPAGLNGRFHGLLIDRSKELAILFNDRYGMQRLYYYETAEAFYFAAEAKAILAVCPELRRLDAHGLGEYITCGCVLENRTLFQGLHVLPPAAAWVLKEGKAERKDAYFRPHEWEEQAVLEPEAYYLQLREVFSRNLPRYFQGRERVGLSLTGGLDTRMIMAWHQPPAGSLPCYSFGGMYRDCQDVIMARRLARACGQEHRVIPVGKEFLARFPHYAQRTVYLTDGCVPVSHSPDLFVNEQVRQIAPIRMTGNYGGEVMRRVRAFKAEEPPAGIFATDLTPQVSAAGDTYQRLIQTHPLSFSVFRQAPWHHYGLSALEQTQITLRSPFLDNQFVQTVFRAPDVATLNNDVCLRLIADGNPQLARIRTDRGIGMGQTGPWAALRRGFLEFTIKSEYAYDYGMPQWVAQIDHLFSALHFERLFLGRHKFYHFRIWYRDPLAGYLQEILLDSRALSRPYLERAGVERMVRGHVKGNQNYTSAIHTVLTLELLHRGLMDAN